MMTGQFVVLEYVARLVALIVFSPSVYYYPCLSWNWMVCTVLYMRTKE